jgi:hypothetical protein
VRQLLAVAIAVTLFAMNAGSANAADDNSCVRPVSENFEARRYPCTSTWVNFFWSQYSMTKAGWDDGFGFFDACNAALPLGRTFNAIEMLHYAMPNDPPNTGDFSGNILHWGGNYALREISELLASCDSTGSAHTMAGSFDDWTKVHEVFFYNRDPQIRAAILVHEARHADWCRHSGGDGSNGCAETPDCDERTAFFGGDACDGVGSPYGMGGYGYGVLWLWWYIVEADSAHSNSSMRAMAATIANFQLNNNFDENPCFNITSTGSTINTCP